jgi:hypothetical protein
MDKSVRILSTMLFCFKQKHDIVSYVKWYTGVKLEDGISLFRSLFIEELKVGWCTQFASSVWTVINTGTKYWNSLGFRTISHQAQSPPTTLKNGGLCFTLHIFGQKFKKSLNLYHGSKIIIFQSSTVAFFAWQFWKLAPPLSATPLNLASPLKKIVKRTWQVFF